MRAPRLFSALASACSGPACSGRPGNLQLVARSLCCVGTLVCRSIVRSQLLALVNRYEKSTNGGGTKLWAPTAQTFPRGLAWLHSQTGFHWELHNRYWSSDCDYATQNNGSYDFFIPGSNCSDPLGNLDVVDWQDKQCSRPGQFSLPQVRILSMYALKCARHTQYTTATGGGGGGVCVCVCVWLRATAPRCLKR